MLPQRNLFPFQLAMTVPRMRSMTKRDNSGEKSRQRKEKLKQRDSIPSQRRLAPMETLKTWKKQTNLTAKTWKKRISKGTKNWLNVSRSFNGRLPTKVWTRKEFDV